MEALLLHPAVMLAIGIISAARVVRLITHDTWPPMEWARPRIAAKLGSWSEIMVCPFCCAPYVMAAQMGLWWWAHNTNIWWWVIPNTWAAAMYVAAMIVAYDQPE
jgi:hypothetical protein